MNTTTEAQQTLAATSDEGLLTAFASLTHRLDRIGERPWSASDQDRTAAATRAQRDLVQAEILRRMGGAR